MPGDLDDRRPSPVYLNPSTPTRRSIMKAPSIGIVLLLSACAPGDAGPPITVTERDSAGIAIVENRIDTAGARTGWAIDPTPTLTIGGLEAPETEQLFRVSGGWRLADGRIVVADGGAAEIRVYGADGALVVAHGGKGEGPGEFQEPKLVGVLGGDSLVVYDRRLRRVSLVHAESGFVRSYLVGTEGGGFPIAIGITGEGGLAVGGGMFFSSQSGFPTGAVRPNSRYVILTPDGSVRGDLGDVPAAEMFARTSGNAFSASALPFGRVTAAAIGPDRLWLGTGDAWEIGGYTLDAKLTRIVRFDRPQPPVTDALRDADLAERLEDAENDDEAREIRSLFRDMPSPERVPPYQIMIVDALGFLWIGEYMLPGERARTYTIVDADGRAVGRVTMPVRTAPLDIGRDYVLGLTRDELDVERLTLWTLRRLD